MCKVNEHLTLSQSDESQITWCKRCKKYTLVFYCCCLAFDKSSLAQFRNLLSNLEEKDYNYTFLGKPHAIIKNHYAEMGISLTPEHVETLLDHIDQALSLNELFKIIYDN